MEMLMKTCSTCKKVKELEEFHKLARSNDGYDYRCKECVKLKNSRATEETKEKARARARARVAANRELARAKTNNWRKETKLKNPAYFLWASARNRARKNNLPFNIERTDVVIPDVCPILGIKLDTQTKKGFCDNAPSVDKIIPELGYVKGNIIVISWRANRIKTDATLQELETIANFYKQFK
jgi:hypothetical protein